MSAARRLSVAVVAPLRFPIRRPHAGGLESAVWAEADALRRRGHEVTFVGVRGSDFVEPGTTFELPPLEWPDDLDPTDITYPPSLETVSVPALDRALDTIAAHPERFDVVSNHCLHALPLLRAPTLGVPMVTTLHTPVDREFVAAHTAARGSGSVFLSVSEHTRRTWAHAGVPSALLANGIDPRAWPEGPGGHALVWFGRIVPEKAPHLAVEVARRLGRPLVVAGRIGDADYARDVFFPSLHDGVRYVGSLPPEELAALVGRSALALSTPAWAEPFGLVAPEALMCATPVVSFAVGGVPEIAAGTPGMRLAPPGDLDAMTRLAAELLDHPDPGLRSRVRTSAVARFSLDVRIDALEGVFADLAAPAAEVLSA